MIFFVRPAFRRSLAAFRAPICGEHVSSENQGQGLYTHLCFCFFQSPPLLCGLLALLGDFSPSEERSGKKSQCRTLNGPLQFSFLLLFHFSLEFLDSLRFLRFGHPIFPALCLQAYGQLRSPARGQSTMTMAMAKIALHTLLQLLGPSMTCPIPFHSMKMQGLSRAALLT